MLSHRVINLETIMFRTLSLALIFGSSLFACAADGSGTVIGNDELGDESNDGEVAKADGVDNFGLVEIRKIGAFECNGAGSCTHLELNRANRTTTTCADGSVAATCEARTLDLSKLNLSNTKIGNVMTALQASAADPSLGTQILARGKFIHGTNQLHAGVDWITFQPTEIWVAQIPDGSTDGTFVRVNDNGRRCIDAPCAATTEGRLNSVKTMDIDGLDWPEEFQKEVTSPGWLPNRVDTALTSTDGAIVVGYRTHGTMMHLPTTLRSINQVYLRVK
jgi:hypothetical protein